MFSQCIRSVYTGIVHDDIRPADPLSQLFEGNFYLFVIGDVATYRNTLPAAVADFLGYGSQCILIASQQSYTGACICEGDRDCPAYPTAGARNDGCVVV